MTYGTKGGPAPSRARGRWLLRSGTSGVGVRAVIASSASIGLVASCVIFEGADVQGTTTNQNTAGTGGGVCHSDAECTAPTPACDAVSGHCVQCITDAHCASGNACVSGACLPRVCEPGTTSCAGNAVATCNATGTGTDTSVPCEAGKTCTATGNTATCVDIPDGGVGGSGGAGGVGGAGGADGGGAGGSGGSGGDAGTGGSGGSTDPKLIDDLEDNDRLILSSEGRVGAWGTEDDGTAGTITAGIPEAIPGGREGSVYGVHVSGSGFEGWSELRVNFNQANPDDVNTSLPYDASKYAGIAFYARGTEGSFRFAAPTADTDALGGTCSACFNHFGVETAITADWQYVTIPWSSLAQEEGWGDMIDAFDAGKLYGVQFIFRGTGAYEIWVDDMAFY